MDIARRVKERYLHSHGQWLEIFHLTSVYCDAHVKKQQLTSGVTGFDLF